MSDYQTITAIIANIIHVFILYQLLHVFLENKRPLRQELGVYGAAYFVLTAIYLIWNIPLLTMLSNILIMLALACFYPASWRRRLLAVAFICSTMFLCETLIIQAMEARGFSHFDDFTNHEYFIAQILCKFFTCLVALWLAKFMRLKADAELPRTYWLALWLVPTMTLVPTYVLLMTVNEAWDIGLCVSVLLLFLLNGLVLYLYEQVIALYQDKLAQQAIREQNRIFLRQLEVEQEAMQKMRQLRHDWNNLLLPILGQMENEDYPEAEQGLRQLVAEMNNNGSIVRGGDPVLTVVINYKLASAQAAGVAVRCTVDVPTDLSQHINVQEVGVLLGNLLDNALRAVEEEERPSGKFIDLRLSVLMGALLIVITNSYAGRLSCEQGQYQTTKADPANHGLGLKTVQRIVDNNGGDMAIETTDETFKVRLKLFLDHTKK